VSQPIDDLMTTNLLRVFGERDAARRRAVIAETYADDVVFADPEEAVTGHDALDAKAQALLDAAPGFVFAADGPVRTSQDLGYLAWTFGPAGAEPVAAGIDVAVVEDGRIARLWTVLTRS
jgi:hypothetical protein